MKDKGVKELLDTLLERLNCGPQSATASVFSQWSAIIGSDLVHKAQLTEIKNKRLIISCDHPVWASTVMMRKKKIIENVNKLYPELEIRQLQVKVKGRQ
ncbi:MAG: DUF721 domain-containing protein [Sphaerochaetaceae bacterium]